MIELDIDQLYFDEVNPIARDLKTSFSRGHLYYIYGRNGIGKTTLFKTLAGMHQGYKGKIDIEKTPLTDFSPQERAKKLAFMFQTETVYPFFKVHEYLDLANIPNDKNSIKKDEFKLFIIRGLQLERHLDRYLKELSQGQFQKVKLATCLLQMTNYIVLDEPFAHLDLIQKERMNVFIQELVSNQNKCVLLSTHHFDLSFKGNNHTLCLTSTQLKILKENENSKEKLIELLST
ncbi:MAG: hypothetical protein CMC18_08985 [Flavobacteriaceae bacterium]|nr:hypothetical protein [Flavobacteriaceae bacterium]